MIPLMADRRDQRRELHTTLKGRGARYSPGAAFMRRPAKDRLRRPRTVVYSMRVPGAAYLDGLRDAMTALAVSDVREGPVLADTVEKLVSRSERVTSPKFDLIELPLLNAMRLGDGL